jgi:hypothetical protein
MKSNFQFFTWAAQGKFFLEETKSSYGFSIFFYAKRFYIIFYWYTTHVNMTSKLKLKYIDKNEIMIRSDKLLWLLEFFRWEAVATPCSASAPSISSTI